LHSTQKQTLFSSNIGASVKTKIFDLAFKHHTQKTRLKLGYLAEIKQISLQTYTGRNTPKYSQVQGVVFLEQPLYLQEKDLRPNSLSLTWGVASPSHVRTL
jgi:hypothetical protein